MTASTDNKVVIPGEVLLLSKENTRPGQGTYELHGKIYASLAGFLFIREDKTKDDVVQVVEVRRSEEKQEHVIPYIGGIVTARVLNIGQKFAKCELLCVEDTPLSSEFSAILRREDLRSTDRDKIDLPKCIQPSDVILARVVSFGDNQTSFILSTAEDQLGVVSAVSENGERMTPSDWSTMKGVRSGITEPRKVAHVPDLNKQLADSFQGTYNLDNYMYGGHAGPWENYGYAPEYGYLGPYYPGTSSDMNLSYTVPGTSNPNLVPLNLSLDPPPPPPPPPPMVTVENTHSAHWDGVTSVGATTSHPSPNLFYSPTSGQQRVVMEPIPDESTYLNFFESRGSKNDHRGRCITPSFEGSGRPIVAGEQHDRIRPMVVKCLSTEQLDTFSKLNQCLKHLSILHGLKGVQDIPEGDERPGKSEDATRKYPSKGFMGSTSQDNEEFRSSVPTRSVTKGEGNNPMVTVLNTNTKLIRKPQKKAAPQASVAASATTSIKSTTTAKAPEKFAGRLPSFASANKMPARDAMRWVRPLVIESDRPASVPVETPIDLEVGSAAINKRRLEMCTDRDIQWNDITTIVEPKKLKIETSDDVVLNEKAVTPEQAVLEDSDVATLNSECAVVSPANLMVTADSSLESSPTEPTVSSSNGVVEPEHPASLFPETAQPAEVVSKSREEHRPSPKQTAMSRHRRGNSRGSMSLRIINGHRITGNCRECYANLEKKCNAGIFCRFEHGGSSDHQKTKICSRLLRGVCRPNNVDCCLEHACLLPHQYPVCSFFLREDCSEGVNCTLLHVKHAPRTKPCDDFNNGTCLRGTECEYPHVYSHYNRERGDYGPSDPTRSALASDPRVPSPEDDGGVMRWIED